MRVFLTGGTGLLGSHLAEELRRADCEVVALHRRHADTLLLEELDCELVEGDVRDDAEVMEPMMRGCTHVVHAAALVYAGMLLYEVKLEQCIAITRKGTWK